VWSYASHAAAAPTSLLPLSVSAHAAPTVPKNQSVMKAVVPVPDVCTCLICFDLLVDPRVTPCCGKAFCLACIARFWDGKATTICPHCMEKATLEGLQVADRTLRRLLSEVVVTCTNGAACDWTGPSGNVDEHLRRMCPLALVPCANAHRGCQKRTTREDAAAHAASCFLGEGELVMTKPTDVRGENEKLRKRLNDAEASVLQLQLDLARRDRTLTIWRRLAYICVAVFVVALAILGRPRIV
jgi:hypothetical protein